MKREPRLSFAGQGAGFEVERWWFPLDIKQESVTRLALCWVEDDETTHVVLLDQRAALELAEECLDYARDCSTTT